MTGQVWKGHDNLTQTLRNRMVQEMVGRILVPSPLEAYLRAHRVPRVPLTYWERLKLRLGDYRERVVTAWRVLCGDDIHEDCW